MIWSSVLIRPPIIFIRDSFSTSRWTNYTNKLFGFNVNVYIFKNFYSTVIVLIEKRFFFDFNCKIHFTSKLIFFLSKGLININSTKIISITNASVYARIPEMSN